eukprot:TRINITY_DN15156_c0_g1_i1.p1 TRINITY_DN15156_c0_g1~~TRINITY_DN15156_c0_g1_i1.p1  ORF type:complete len:924 (+),score=246.34 TRINITY_DN15156_c0_g1_i1:65-2773(+)
MAAQPEPLLGQRKAVKPTNIFGYWPVWSECVPQDATGKTDSVRLLANIVAGCVIGVRQTLSAIVSATLVFTSSKDENIVEMFPYGIGMMWYSTMVGSLWYAIFGRLQYNTSATQELCAILYAAMAQQAASALQSTPEKIGPTILALIMTSTVLTGVCSIIFGSFGIGKVMLRFPTPVTSGFLGTIGFFLVKAALVITSGVQFKYFYPVDFDAFLAQRSLMPTTCLFVMVFFFMRRGPGILKRMFPHNDFCKRMGGLLCQLFPLALFYFVVFALQLDVDSLSDAGWTYPAEASNGFMSLWTTYNVANADVMTVARAVPNMFSLVIMSVLCTMTGVLGITGKFPVGPDGDPAPLEAIDFDKELITVGWGAILQGFTNGVVTFHRLGSSIQIRLDGGTHRIAVITSSLFVSAWFFSSVPLGHYIPKWFLGGLFMGSGISFLEGAIYSYKTLPPSPFVICGITPPNMQYFVTIICIIVAAFSSPFTGIGSGLAMSVVLFLWESSETSPVASMTKGSQTVSRTVRPPWELKLLRQEGDRIVVLYLQGALFFGSGEALASAVSKVASQERVEFCVLSFAKVTSIDMSAAQQLKAAADKAGVNGCKVLYCRMNQSVRETLLATKTIKMPDKDLSAMLNDSRTGFASFDLPPKSAEKSPVSSDTQHVDEHEMGLTPHPAAMQRMFSQSIDNPLGTGDYDAFDHESDALDFCADKLLSELLYDSNRSVTLKPYMGAFRESCMHGERLTSEMFEEMHNLPKGFMNALSPFCENIKLAPGSELRKDEMALHFVFRGAITLFDEAAPPQEYGFRLKGFGGRSVDGKVQKRLRKRFLPGSLIGSFVFFLGDTNSLVDPEIVPEMHVSSKLSRITEIWTLTMENWKKLPLELQDNLSRVIIRLMAEERQHTLLSGE